MHIPQNEFLAVTKVVTVHLLLILIDVIGKRDAPACSLQGKRLVETVILIQAGRSGPSRSL